MFTSEHFLWIGICIFLISVLTYVSLRMKFPFRTATIIMAVVAFVSETTKILTHMEFVNGKNFSRGMVLDAGALPLHLCSLLIFAFFYLPFAKDGRLKRFIVSLTVPVGLIGSLLAILMATSGTKFSAPEPYQCFIYHAVLTWFAIYLVATKQVELGKRAWLTNLLTLLALTVSMIWVNSLLQVYDTNFWYVVRPPVKGLPLLNLERGWYAYFGTLLLLGLLCLTAVHLPFMIKEKRKKQERTDNIK